MNVKFSSLAVPKSGVVVIFAQEGGKLTDAGLQIDSRTNGQVGKAMKAAGFTAKREQSLDIVAPGGGYDRVVVYGVGNPDQLQRLEVEHLGGVIAGGLQAMRCREAAVMADLKVNALGSAEVPALVASGARLRSYSFHLYKSKKPERLRLAQ